MKKLIVPLLLLLLASASLAALIGNTEDPFKISVGARSMGMGGAWAAVIDGSNNMFNNPAGMYDQQLQMSSMYTSLLGDVNYMVLGANWPVGLGSLGLGLAGSNVSSVITPTQAGFDYFNYYNNVLAMSYASKYKNLTWGARLKYFDEGFTGSTNYAGRGWDVDLGAHFMMGKKTRLGLVLSNIIPVSMGGRIVWPNGDEEEIPFGARIGIASHQWRDDVLLALDADLVRRSTYGTRTHAGAEWKVNNNFRLRGGLDQSYSLGRIQADPTVGLTLQLQAFSFDYAYHPYFEDIGSLTHYFSFSYDADGWLKKTVIPAAKPVVAAPPPPVKAPVAAAPIVIVVTKEVATTPIVVTKRIFHYISRGETFSYIANKYYGTADVYPELAEYNKVKILGKDKVPGGVKYIYIAPTAELMKLREQKKKPVKLTPEQVIKQIEPILPEVMMPTPVKKLVEEKSAPVKVRYHFTSRGDTFNKLAEKYYGSADYAEALRDYNGSKARVTSALSNQVVKIPPASELGVEEVIEELPPPPPSPPTPPPAVIIATPESLPVPKAPAEVRTGGPEKKLFHFISSSDTLMGISVKYYGISDYYLKLARINNLKPPYNLSPGRYLLIPTEQELLDMGEE